MIFTSRGSSRPFSGLPATAESVASIARVWRANRNMRCNAGRRLFQARYPSQIRRRSASSYGSNSIGLPLPSSPNHKLLEVIAAATDLQIEQVQEVQKLRVARGSPSP